MGNSKVQINRRLRIRHPLVFVLFAGIIPFSGIVVELSYFLTSLWTCKFFSDYGISLAVFFTTCVVTAGVGVSSIVLCNELANSENAEIQKWSWEWVSFRAGAISSLSIASYGVYYLVQMTKFRGLVAMTVCFPQIIIIAVFVGLINGSVAYLAAQKFVLFMKSRKEK